MNRLPDHLAYAFCIIRPAATAVHISTNPL